MYRNYRFVPSEKTDLPNIQTVVIVLLIAAAMGLGIFFLWKLVKGKPSPTYGPTNRPNNTNGPTNRPTNRPNTNGPNTPNNTNGPNTPNNTNGPNTPNNTNGPNRPNNTNGPNRPQQMLFYGASGNKLSYDNPCYNCHLKNNQCACYANNNCSVSPQNFEIPPACSGMPCLQYETQDESGVADSVCNQNGIDLFKSVVNDPYLCNSSNPQKTCKDQCAQHDSPFDQFPFCKSCCDSACALQNCRGSPTRTGSPIRTFPPPSDCSTCKTLCHMNSNSDYCRSETCQSCMNN